jgi:D-arabinose 1-dehydrogenase-like Zn-dependent alcohol dehydrogenase
MTFMPPRWLGVPWVYFAAILCADLCHDRIHLNYLRTLTPNMTHVHLIGIGGSGLSAIARLLKESGYTVTGSDRTLTSFAEDLQAVGVTIYIGHHPAQYSRRGLDRPIIRHSR